MLIDSPFEVDSSQWGYLVGLLTHASSNRSRLPRAFAPVASIAPALRAPSGGAVPVFHRLPVCTKLAVIKSPRGTQCQAGILKVPIAGVDNIKMNRRGKTETGFSR